MYPTTLRLKNVSFVNKTPNGDAKAIKVEYETSNSMVITIEEYEGQQNLKRSYNHDCARLYGRN